MTSTIVGYFDDLTEARRTEQDLLDAGYGREAVQIVGSEGKQENWWERFKSAFGVDGDHERSYYEAAARRGGALVTVRVDDAHTNEVAAILERHHPIDLTQEGAGLTGHAAATRTTETDVSDIGLREGYAESQSIPLAEEEVVVGKRAVQRGALRIHTYTTERPVEERVALREEEAYVERTPVDRPAVAGEAAFQDRTLEVREMGEEAVVNKQARVVEEVRVGKQQTERKETVRDTVRKQEVDVERVDGARVDRTETSRSLR